MLQSDVMVDADTACRIYESCKSVAIVGETTAMQSGLGLLKFQMQTGAVGHGEFFNLAFSNATTRTAPSTKASLDDERWQEQIRESDLKGLSLETLSCESFFDPGSSTIPFPYPPPQRDLATCR